MAASVDPGETISSAPTQTIKRKLQIERASQRDGQNIEQIRNIIAAQMSREQKQTMADDIVLNDGHLDHLYAHLRPLHQKYLNMAAS